MLDLSAFESRPGEVYDADGLIVPTPWNHTLGKWAQLPLAYRKTRSEQYLCELAKKDAAKPKRFISRAPAKRFSTDYAIAWGRAQGWKLLDRENYDARLRRHHDLTLGADAMFDTQEGIALVQGAGKSERSTHRRRFEERGGSQKAQRMKVSFHYVEFVRGEPVPIVHEVWA